MSDFSISMGLVGHAQVIQGVESLINLLGQATDKIKEWAAEAQAYDRAVNGHTISVREADEATAGLIDTLVLHREASRLQAAGVDVSEESLRGLAATADTYSRRTGDDLTETFERLTKAVIAAESEGLRKFGFQLQRNGTLGERQQQVLRDMTEATEGYRAEITNTGEAISQLENTWGTAWDEMLLALERNSGPIGDMLQTITGWVQDVATALETQRIAMDNMASRGNELRRRELEGRLRARGVNLETFQQVSLGDQSINTIAGRVIEAGRDLAGAAIEGRLVEAFTEGEQGAIRRDIEELLRLERDDAANPNVQAPRLDLNVPERRRGRGGRGRGGGTRRSETVILDPKAEHLIEVDKINDRIAQSELELDEILQSLADVEADRIATLEDAEIAAAERTAQAVEEGNARKIAANELYQKSLEETAARHQRVIDGMDLMGDVVGATSNIMGNIGDTVREVAGETEKATKAMMIVEGTFLVAENVAMSVTEAAKAIASAASQDYGGAVLHGLASAAHASAAVTAAARLGSSQSASSATASVPRPASGGGSSGGNEPATVVYINGPVTSHRVHEEMQNMERDSMRSHG